MQRRPCLLAAGAAAAMLGLLIPGLPAWAEAPHAFQLPHAPYVGLDGTVTIVGYNDMESILSALDRLFMRSHPGVRFRLVLKGTRTAPPALADSTSAFAPMGAPFSPDESRAYRAATGADPVMFRIAHASLNPTAKSAPLGIFVATAHPARRMTMADVAKAFTDPATPFHPIGLTPATALGRFMLGELQRPDFAPQFRGFDQSRDVVAAVAEDPQAIGFAAANLARPGVRLLAIAPTEGAAYVAPTRAAIAAGDYPLDRFLHIFARRPIDDFVAAYLRLVFSRAGQQAIAADALGYIPLNPRELATERAKLSEGRQP